MSEAFSDRYLCNNLGITAFNMLSKGSLVTYVVLNPAIAASSARGMQGLLERWFFQDII